MYKNITINPTLITPPTSIFRLTNLLNQKMGNLHNIMQIMQILRSLDGLDDLLGGRIVIQFLHVLGMQIVRFHITITDRQCQRRAIERRCNVIVGGQQVLPIGKVVFSLVSFLLLAFENGFGMHR